MKSKKRILVTICAVALIITSFGVIGASAASELMDANLNGKFHYVPILKDPMEASTYYGHGNDNATAQCNTSVKAYNGAGEYNTVITPWSVHPGVCRISVKNFLAPTSRP